MSADPYSVIDSQLFRATPPAYSEHMAKVAMKLLKRHTNTKPRILEPSAGSGVLMRACREAGAAVLGVEIDQWAARNLKLTGFPCVCADFLKLTPSGLFDGVVMNPPAREEVAHVIHALKFLKVGGPLVAVMSPSWKARQPTFKTFAEMLYSLNAEKHDIPTGTFMDGGRNIATTLIVLTK